MSEPLGAWLKGLYFKARGALKGMPADAASHLEAISDHLTGILGPSFEDLHERYSPDLHIDLLHWAPGARVKGSEHW